MTDIPWNYRGTPGSVGEYCTIYSEKIGRIIARHVSPEDAKEIINAINYRHDEISTEALSALDGRLSAYYHGRPYKKRDDLRTILREGLAAHDAVEGIPLCTRLAPDCHARAGSACMNGVQCTPLDLGVDHAESPQGLSAAAAYIKQLETTLAKIFPDGIPFNDILDGKFAVRIDERRNRYTSWINIKDKQPKLHEDVLFIAQSTGHLDYLTGKIFSGKYQGNEFGYEEFSIPGITMRGTYWMPLPPLPVKRIRE